MPAQATKIAYDYSSLHGAIIVEGECLALAASVQSTTHNNAQARRVDVQVNNASQIAGLCSVAAPAIASSVSLSSAAHAQAVTRRGTTRTAGWSLQRASIYVSVQNLLSREDALVMSGFGSWQTASIDVVVTQGVETFPTSGVPSPFYAESNISEYVNITLGGDKVRPAVVYGLPPGLVLKKGAICGTPSAHGEYRVRGQYTDGSELHGTIYIYPYHRKK